MKNYMKPEMEICVIEEEDVLMGSTIGPADEFSETTSQAQKGENT